MKAKDERIFRTASGALLASALAVSAYHRREAERIGGGVSWEEEGLPTILASRASGLALWLSAAAYPLNPRWMRWASLDLPAGVRFSGAVVAAASLPLARWVFSSIGENVTHTVETRKRHELVTDGPYRWVRHPLYSVGALFFFSYAVVSANWFVGLSTLGLVAARLPKEEEKLIERFGEEYRAYARRTGRLLPRLGVRRGEE